MAKTDHVPNLVRVAFPDGIEKTSTKPGQPAGNDSMERQGDAPGYASSAPSLGPSRCHRRHFIGGSDARIVMSDDEATLLRLWREKRGEIKPADLSTNLLVQLGLVTEDLNRRWYEVNCRQVVVDVQRRIRHPVLHWMGATLDGRVEGSGAIFEAKFMLPWSFSEEFRHRKIRAATSTQHVDCRRPRRGSVDHNRGREVGGDQDPRRPALPAPYRHGRAHVLALRGKR